MSATAPASGLSLGSVAGVRIRVAPSWLVIAGAVTVLYAGTVESYTGMPGLAAYAGAFAFAVLLAVSVLVHEAVHATAARAFGLHVDEIVVDLWGGHTSLGAPRTPLSSAVVAVLAPLANVAIGVTGLGVGLVWRPDGLAEFLLDATTLSNLLVGLFNLLPGLPLDGGRVTEAIVWAIGRDRDLGALVAGWAGRLVVAAAVLLFLGLPLLRGQFPGLITIVWVSLLGATLWRAASASIRVARTRRAVRRVGIGPLTARAAGADAGLSVAAWQERSGAGSLAVLLTDPAGRAVAVVDPAAAAQVPVAARESTAAMSVAIRTMPGAVVDEGASLLDAIERSEGATGPGLVVTASGRIVGWVPAEALRNAAEVAVRGR